MRPNCRPFQCLLLVLGIIVFGIQIIATTGFAGDTGVLKLKVQSCAGTFWLKNAQVDVSIQRSGVGEVDSDTGWTDASGYVEFTFTDLEGGDQAHVTVTPEGQSPDSGHVYYWVPPRNRVAGYWDLDVQSLSICSDGWHDQENNIILLRYN